MLIRVGAIGAMKATEDNLDWIKSYSDSLPWKTEICYKMLKLKNRNREYLHVYLDCFLPKEELHKDTDWDYISRNRVEDEM